MSTDNPTDRADCPGFADGRHEGYLRRYLTRRLRNGQDAREMAQEVWTRLLRVEDPRSVHSPMAYIRRTAANVLAEFHMRQSRDPVTFDSELVDIAAGWPDTTPSDELVEQVSAQQQLQRILAMLPGMYRNIVLMRLCDGAEYREIGLRLGLSAGTAERYFFRAMKTIRAAKWK